MHGVGELARFVQVGMRSLAPDELDIRRVGKGPGNGGLDPAANSVEAFRSSFSGEEFAVARIDVAGQQVCAVGVGTRHDERGRA